jgi:hypothetical protein
MKSKMPKAGRRPTLQTLELVEITDPAEQAALDERCRKADEYLAAAAANAGQAQTGKNRVRKGSVAPKA